MPNSHKVNADNNQQSEQFKELARSLECDESEELFDETLKKVARHKPTKDKKDNEEDRDNAGPP